MTGDDDHDGDAMVVVAAPPAHSQLLSDEHASSAALTGYDHTRDGRDDDDDDDDDQWCRQKQKLSAVKQQGGGSWLLGSFARLRAMDVPRGASLDADEDASTASESSDHDAHRPGRAAGVSFAPTVTVRPIPHAAALSALQRCRMYTSSVDVRANKVRNKKEFRHDGYNWRAVAEEWEMGVDMVTGELVHPAHAHLYGV